MTPKQIVKTSLFERIALVIIWSLVVIVIFATIRVIKLNQFKQEMSRQKQQIEKCYTQGATDHYMQDGHVICVFPGKSLHL